MLKFFLQPRLHTDIITKFKIFFTVTYLLHHIWILQQVVHLDIKMEVIR